jgi:hypothetical protein
MRFEAKFPAHKGPAFEWKIKALGCHAVHANIVLDRTDNGFVANITTSWCILFLVIPKIWEQFPKHKKITS